MIPYTGNPTGVQTPSPLPALGGAPIVNIPTAGDRGADLWAQALKALADFDAFLASKLPTPGALLALRVITASGNYPVTASTKSAIIDLWAAAGAGGGTPFLSLSPGNQISVGGGGASGQHGRLRTTNIPGTNWIFVLGAPGAGVSGANGADAANSTVQDSAATMTVHGGKGGNVGSGSVSTGDTQLGGAAPLAALNASDDYSGEPGGAGWSFEGSSSFAMGVSGKGGSSDVGHGGQSVIGRGAGIDGTGYASGGSGAMSWGSTFANQPAQAGGAGRPAYGLLWEFS